MPRPAFLLLLFLLDSQQATLLLQRGLVALQHGQLTEARDNLEQASKADPQNAYVWSSLAETYLRLKQPQQASSAADNAEKFGADNPLVCHALAMYYSEAGQLGRAAQFEEKFAASPKADSEALSRAAGLYLRSGEFTRAADLAQSGLAAHPDDPQLALTLGVARYGQRRFEDTIVAFLKVIQIDPSIEQPYVFLGRILDQAGPHLPEITKAYENWAARDPKNPKAQLVLAKALLTDDPRSERAEGLLRRSIELDGKGWEAHYQLGILLSNKRQYQAAAAELTRSIELDANQAMPHYHLARVYDRLGEPERAKAEREIHQRMTK